MKLEKNQKKQKSNNKKMGNDIKTFFVLAIAVIIGFIILFISIAKPKDVATINNSKITNNEFQFYYSQNVSYALQSSGSTDAEAYLNSSSGSGTVKDVIKQQTISQVVQIEILLLKAKEDHFKVSNSEIQQQWLTYKNTLLQNAQNSQMTIEDFLKATFGLSLNKVQSIFKDNVISQKYFDAEASKIAVDDAKLSAYYEENKTYIDRASVRHILITCAKDAKEDVVAEKKKLAEDILVKVNKGDDFSALAKEYSEDSGSKDNGGLYEIQPNGQMMAEFEDWTFSHKAGDTGIIKTTYGFHIMKLDSIMNTLESQKDDIMKTYRMGEYQKVIEEILQGDKYKIEVKEGYESF
ncbi:MAG: peptidylprolyl isomerase [Clostridiales bacterium]|nr:peptidylprolyl isomerase [Clostridiales bacterium]